VSLQGRKYGVPARLPGGRRNPEFTRAYRLAHLESIREKSRLYRLTHREVLKAWKHEYYLAHVNELRKANKAYYFGHLKQSKEQQKRFYLRMRREAFDHYGWSCVKCNESNEGFLTLDHINDDGAVHRRKHGSNLYLWASKNGYPPILQTMCYNCQWVKELRRRERGSFANHEEFIGLEKWSGGASKGFCSGCKARMTPEFCRPSVLLAGYGLCRHCQSKDEFERAQRIKSEVIGHYGGKCECCGETSLERLTLGHPNGDGSYDRKLSGRGTQFYNKLRRNNYQSPFQLRVECINCNFGSHRNSGICPHLTLVASHSRT
jgi:hypothetical protein